MRVRLFQSIFAFAALSVAGSASAHVDLTYPPARLLGSANGNQIKQAPCGQTTNMRTATVTTFTPGQMVDIKLEEYVDHTGYFVVSFDNEGDNDFPYPRANSDMVNPDTDDPMATMPTGDKVLGYHFDEAMNCANQPNSECVIKVKIPNVNCQSCTLQLVQFMYDKTGDGQPNEHYFQCADIKVEGALMPGGGAGGMAGAGGAGGAGGGGAGGSAGGTGGASGGAPTGGVATGGVPIGGSSVGGSPSGGTGTAGTGTVGPTTADDSSCSIASVGRVNRSSAALALSLLGGLALSARRRKRGTRRSPGGARSSRASR